MAKVDPDQLEKEADELMAKLTAEEETPSNPETETEAKEPAPEEVEENEETVEASAEEAEQLNPDVPEDTEVESEDSEKVQDDSEDTDETLESESPEKSVLEERYKNAQAWGTKASQEAADLRSEKASLEKEKAELLVQLKASRLTPAPVEQIAMDSDMKTLMEDYPDIAKPLINKLNSLQAEVRESNQEQQQREDDRLITDHLAAIEAAHPDIEAIKSSKDFEGWMSRQSSFYQRIASEGSAEDVIELLNVYKKASGLDTPSIDNSSKKKAAKLAAAKKVADPKLPKTRQSSSGNSKPSFTADEISNMSDKDFAKYEKEIDNAYTRGRIT